MFALLEWRRRPLSAGRHVAERNLREMSSVRPARIAIRSTRAEWEFRKPPAGWPRNAKRWHLYGDGTASCTWVSHPAETAKAPSTRSVSGRINHVDFAFLYPSLPAGRTLTIGITPLWSNPLPETLKNAILRPSVCGPVLFALGNAFPHGRKGLSVADLLATDGVTARVRSQWQSGLGALLPAWTGLGRNRYLEVNVGTRLSAVFRTR